MNFFNALKSAKEFIDTSAEVYNTIRSSLPSGSDKSTVTFEKVSLANFTAHESNASNAFCIFVAKKAAQKNAEQLFHVIFVEVSIVVFKTNKLDVAKHLTVRLNSFSQLAQTSVKNGLTEKFLSLALKNPSWADVHLACSLGLPNYVRDVCQRGDALSIINSPTRDEGLFPMHLAAECGFVHLVDMLLDLGADVLKIDLRAWNTLHFAINASDETLGASVLETIAKKRPAAFVSALTRASEDNKTPLMMVLSRNKLIALHVIINFDKKVIAEHESRIFATSIDSQCLDVLLEADSELLRRQTESHNLLHRSFRGDVLKVIAQRALYALELRLGSLNITPLHSACQRSDLDATIALLSHGADLNAIDRASNTPLHLATMAGAVPVVQLLLCFGADYQAKNSLGHTALALAEKSSCVELIRLLKNVLKWEMPRDSPIGSASKSALEAKQLSAIFKRLTMPVEERQQQVRLLALDGGGIRGLVLIQTLIEIEKQLGGNVIDYFDWLSGTSTGAILALALADGTSSRDCLRLYLRLKDEVFSQKTDSQSLDSPMPGGPRLRLYSEKKLEHFLQQHFGVNRTLDEICGKRVVVTTTRANINPPELVLYRNYDPPSHLDPATAKNFQNPSRMTIWKAARCSSAAPTYFSSVDGVFMDGGLVANNPSLDLLAEVQLYNDSLLMEGKKENELALLVSLGTGRMPLKKMNNIDVGVLSNENSSGGLLENFAALYRNFAAIQNLKTILVEQVACSDGHVVERARAWAHSLGTPYFRLTPQLAQDVPLDATDNDTLVALLWTTKTYLYEDGRNDFDSLISFLRRYSQSVA